ncbi:amino acid adenylation domain-containing protein [Kibdelosporangium persicum]|uniref:Dimodular nonribosomal peptide synthase n=1 Tax=Kibdelosporangium persicum TaxID=2698649 RepID=A0ABX2FL42_9PSEU|nr:amino acid adenylation domain-containing protein [Kibdelosporangium persicum]NRN71460.1 Dimodular nonribosomal peptide synthase [Kibdelosporangium persicum]
MSTFVDDILLHAVTSPRAPAIVTPGEVITYEEMAVRIERLARVLVARGSGPEQVCAIAVDRGAEAVIAMAAVLRAAGAFLALDVDLPRPRLAAMVRSAQARCLVTTRTLAERLSLPVPGPAVFADQSDVDAALPPVDPRSLAYVTHTSGSTGTPNAVLIEHRGLTNYLRFVVRDYELSQDTTVLQLAPLGYDASIRDTFAPLVAGGRLVLVPRSTLLRADEFAATVREHGVNTVLSATPTFLTFLSQHEVPALRLTVSSGESLRPFLAAGGRESVGERLVNQYGPTEATMTSTRFFVPRSPETTTDVVGTPIDGVTVHLLDDYLRTVPDGAVGEVWIGGLGVARGYCGRPELTAARFVPDPHGEPGARMYRTGDLARRAPDGNLDYLGRSDRQTKIRGYRVDPAEIEGSLLSHPAVTGAVVTAATDDRGRTYLVAHVVGDLADVTDTALRAHLAMTLPPYMMPRRFVRIDHLPTTTSGKADRRALATDAR